MPNVTRKPYCLSCQKQIGEEFVESHKALNHRVESYIFGGRPQSPQIKIEIKPDKENELKLDLIETYEEEDPAEEEEGI